MPVLSYFAIEQIKDIAFWKGVEAVVGGPMNYEQRAAASVCFFLWWGAT